jgi:hypothetical protein
MEETLPTRKSRGTTFGCPSIGTSAFSLSETDCAKIVAEACRPPQDVGVPVARWSEHLLGDYLRAQGFALSDSTVGRILRGAILQPHRQKMWVTSHDDEFREKRDDVLRVYYDTPPDEHIICVDEKTGMQALERRHPDLPITTVLNTCALDGAEALVEDGLRDGLGRAAPARRLLHPNR